MLAAIIGWSENFYKFLTNHGPILAFLISVWPLWSFISNPQDWINLTVSGCVERRTMWQVWLLFHHWSFFRIQILKILAKGKSFRTSIVFQISHLGSKSTIIPKGQLFCKKIKRICYSNFSSKHWNIIICRPFEKLLVWNFNWQVFLWIYSDK